MKHIKIGSEKTANLIQDKLSELGYDYKDFEINMLDEIELNVFSKECLNALKGIVKQYKLKDVKL